MALFDVISYECTECPSQMGTSCHHKTADPDAVEVGPPYHRVTGHRTVTRLVILITSIALVTQFVSG